MKKKTLKIFLVTMLFTALYAINVFAAEEVQENNVQRDVNDLQRTYKAFERTYSFYETVWGETIELQITVCFEIDYDYSEGNWYEIYYANIGPVTATVNGRAVQVTSMNYVVNSTGAVRYIKVEDQDICIYLMYNEWRLNYGAELV